jgi:ribonuclease HII
MNLYEYDDYLKKTDNVKIICGVDEAGRGPLAGDVYAAAVILPVEPITGINDSKKLSEKKRDLLYNEITINAISYGIGIASVAEIDEYNILGATMLAMKRAVQQINVPYEYVYIDGNKVPNELFTRAKCIVKGDTLSASIAAASIIAKVSRDRYMLDMDRIYSQYGFAKHKGYGTKMHYTNISKYGICPIHRVSFLKNILNV